MNVHLFFSKYIYEQKVLSFYLVIFFLSLSLLFLYLSRLPLFSPPLPSPSTPLLASSSPLSPRLIFLGAMRISSMARFRPPLETSHSTMPLVEEKIDWHWFFKIFHKLLETRSFLFFKEVHLFFY